MHENDSHDDEDSPTRPLTSETPLTAPTPYGNGDSNLAMGKTKKLPQIVAAIAASIGAFGLGNVVAWSSPALITLKKDLNFSDLTPTDETWIGSICTIGAIISTLISGPIIDCLGRKLTMLILGFPFLFGWLMVSFAPSLTVMLIGRFITGFCGGAFTLIVPVYNGEIAEPSIRGTLSAGMVMILVGGILFVYVVGALVNWFWLSIICTFVPVIFLGSMTFMPESPTFLLMKNKHLQAKQALQWFRRGPPELVVEELNEIERSLNESYRQPIEFCKPQVLKPFGICLVLMLLQQASLINVVVFYASNIFKSAGSSIEPNTCSIIIGTVQLIFAGVSTILVDKAGRKILLIVSSFGSAIALGVLGLYFYLKETGEIGEGELGWLPLISLIVFIITYNLGLGPLPWCMLSELMGSSRIKSYTSSIAASYCWFLAFLVTKFYSDLQSAVGVANFYWIFAGITAGGVLFATFIVPETKGKSLDEIQRLFK